MINWISMQDEKPPESTRILIRTRLGMYFAELHNKQWRLFLSKRVICPFDIYKIYDVVTHWSELND